MYLIEDKLNELLHKSTQNTSYSNNNKVPIIQSMVYDHLMYTNEQYQKRINKSQKEIDRVTFSNDDFNQFLEKSINESRFSNWKQVPISTKKELVNTYITNDLNIKNSDKSIYLDFFKDHTVFMKKNLIKYNCKKGEISNINYNQIC